MTRGTAGSVATVAVVAGALAVTGAGVAAPQGVTTAKLRANANGAFKYNKSKLTVPAGTVKFKFKNPASSGLKHGLEIEGHGIEKRAKNVKPGKSSSVTVKLKAGKTYEFYCPVDGHHAAGMEGKIVVK